MAISIGWNLVGYTSLVATTLSNGVMDNTSGLFNSGFTGGLTQTESDRLFSWNGFGWDVQYMYVDGGAFDGTWIGTTLDLEPGRGYWIEVKAVNTAFVWSYG